MNYRILTNGEGFKIQWRFLWLFWMDVVYDQTYELLQFEKREEAEAWIDSKIWRVVK